MKADETNLSETIWAYLHGELGEDARQALERQMAHDPELRLRFESARQMDRLFRATLPALDTCDTTEAALVGQALAAWESEQAVAAQPPASFAAGARWPTFFRRGAVGAAGVAVAALFVLAVSPALRAPDGVTWAEPVFAPLTLRGSGLPAEGASLAPATAARCQEVLRAAVEKDLATRGVTVPRATLSFRLQALRRGAFSVAVTARQRDGRVVGEWGGDYSGIEAFLSQKEASAARIAETLAACGEAGAKGGQP